MKIIMGVIPCKDRFFLDKALVIVKPGIEHILSLIEGEDTFLKIAIDLYVGGKQLTMVYLDNENIPSEREQEHVIKKLLEGGKKDYVGYGIIEFWQTAIHICQINFLPEYHNVEYLSLAYNKLEKQARLYGAPYISVSTQEQHNEIAKFFGFTAAYTIYRKKIKEGA